VDRRTLQQSAGFRIPHHPELRTTTDHARRPSAPQRSTMDTSKRARSITVEARSGSRGREFKSR
jgi:hypothetical protein